MHVFVTGGTGHIGSYVVPELIAAGHEVTGLAKSDESAAAFLASPDSSVMTASELAVDGGLAQL